MKNNPFPIQQITSLNLKFDEQGTAYSNNYADIYYQPGIGLDEKRHVFLKGNHLPNNWLNTKSFTIAETGFGTGLNFLNTLQLWEKTREPQQQLHYVSCELHPLNKNQLNQTLAQFPQLTQHTKELLKLYPKQLIYGFHRLHFIDYNVILTLIFGDAVDAFNQLDADVDAWFLDGFSPSKNPKMWSDALFKAIAYLSHVGTTVATFTVARKIRDGLNAVGFEVNKATGFGQKREMLTAKLKTENKLIEKQPWSQTFKADKQHCFTVLGAGIAGLTLANKLIQQGKNVTLIDRQKKPCLETSGNPQAVVMPSFDLNGSVEARFYLSAFLYAIRYYSQQNYHPVGVHQLALSEKQKNWQQQLLSRLDLSPQLFQKYKNGLLYPQAGWLDTQSHAQHIFQQVENYLQAEIHTIKFKDNSWYLYSNDKLIHRTSTLIIANGIFVTKLLPNYELPITPKHGEISYFHSCDIDSKIADNPHIQLGEGYITPSHNGIQTIGATFDHIAKKDWFKAPKTHNNHWQRNIGLWHGTSYAEILKKNIGYQSRAGIRVTTPDHMPICGAVIDQQHFKKNYNDINHGKYWKTYPIPKAINNLYLFTGLGSKGFTTAPLLAESLCNQMLSTPQVLSKELQKAIHPSRFLFKQLKKTTDS